MQPLTPNFVIAALGPFAELVAVAVVVGVFTLLRGQAERRTYFRTWERSWIALASALIAGFVYQRITDPHGVLYSGSHFTTWLFAAAYIASRLVSLALLVAGFRLLVDGVRSVLLVRAAAPLGVILTIALADTHAWPLGAFALDVGLLAVAAYAYVARLQASLPASRRSGGTRAATYAAAALAALWLALFSFHVAQRVNPALTSGVMVVRFERYGFYLDLVLQLFLASAMLRLLFEDGKREASDTRAHLDLLQDRTRQPELYDPQTGLLNNRATRTSIGLDFARASFGSVVRLRITNLDAVASAHGPAVSDALVTHVAGIVDSAVRTHDRVYRWNEREFLVVMPRAPEDVARGRMEYVMSRAAPLALPNVGDAIRAEAAIDVARFSGAEDLFDAVAKVTQ